MTKVLSMKLADILRNCEDLIEGGASAWQSAAEMEISGIENDSRLVKDDTLFVALIGTKGNGDEFLADAHQRGVTVAIHDQTMQVSAQLQSEMTLLASKAPRTLLGRMLQNFYAGKLPKYLVGITGTSGKTSSVEFVRQLLSVLGKKSASLGTFGLMCSKTVGMVDGELIEGVGLGAPLTTADICDVYRFLSYAKQNRDIDYVAMETASHGLDQERVAGLQFAAGVFTNLSSEHLDYHKTMEAYLEAKLLLFRKYLAADGTAVINADVPEYEKVAAAAKERNLKILDFGKQANSLRILGETETDLGQELKFSYNGQEYNTHLGVLGDFQSYNVLDAVASVLSLGFKIEDIVKAMPRLKAARGRLDLAGVHPNGAKIYIDFAHKPDALEKVLKAMRPFCKNRLIILFGCGGDRDKTKRPMMGKIANDLADVAIISDDNPRTEDPAQIRKEILAGCPKGIERGGLKEAIEQTIQELQPGDVLIIAGKGHEDYQILGTTKIHFDEFEVVTDALKKLATK